MTDFAPLRSAISSAVLEPSDPGYAEALSGFSLLYLHTPEAVVVAADADAVAETVRFAAASGLPVRALATGHGSHASITDGIVVSTSAFDSVTIDASSRIATIGGGSSWGPVVAAAAEHGLAPITGSASSVGAAGYLLGGGLGPLARSHGFSSDWVRGFTVVTGTGDVVEATADENPDLFWALRGGKGGLGIVLQTRVELLPIEALYAGSLMFAAEDIETVLRVWVEFTGTAPADVTTSVAIMRFPPFEQIPEPMRGKTLLAVRFAYPGDAETGARLATPLREAATPVIDALGVLPFANIAAIHNDPTDPSPAVTSGGLLHFVDQDFVTALIEAAGPGIDLPIVAVELRHIGSATRTDVAGGSAVGGRNSDFTYNLVGAVPVPEAEAGVLGASRAVVAALAPWVADETTINFAGLVTGDDFARAWTPETFERLASVRASFDPEGVFAYGPAEAAG